ncbi:hypothetical protein ACI2K4_35285 [Micromonospora sp. NPDC050397]|uniref:hypothetical protein n=1 Tax=Micromonospora sp. NPDC050397 TaxID=3364279 RepID=UPI00384FE22C
MDSLAQEQLAVLCVRLEEEVGPLATDGPMRTLATLIAERIRAGEDPVTLAEHLDELDDQLLRAGYAGGLGSYRSALPQLPGLGGHPVLEVLACPGLLCARVAPPDREHTCAVFGRSLDRVRLRP